MDKKVDAEQKQYMLLRQVKDGKVKAVKNIDTKGNPTTVDPTEGNIADLLNVNTQDSFLEAFFKKFLEQVSDPTYTGIFVVSENILSKLIKIDFEDEEMNKHRIDARAKLQKMQSENEIEGYQPLDITKIDLDDMERKGIKLDDLEPFLKAMSYGHKSHQLIDMTPQLAPGVRISTKGRVSLQEQPDGTLKVIPHYWKEKPNLNAPFYGITLDKETKDSLAATCNAGKIIDLELQPGEKTPCFVSLDPLTNTLEAMPVSDLGEISNLKNVDLTPGQITDIYAGHKILVEGMTSRSGTLFDGYIQVNASDRKFDFTYEGLDRRRYAEANREIRQQQHAEGYTQQPGAGETSSLTIHKYILKAKVPQQAYDHWTEAAADPSKRADVQAFYIEGMVNGKGEKFNAFVKPDFEEGKMKFYKWNPDKKQSQGTKETTAQQKQQTSKASDTTKPSQRQGRGFHQ